jgi:hypothetical protein
VFAASPVAAQSSGFVSLRVRNGTEWAESTSIAGPTTMTFRWTWYDMAPVRAWWQISMVPQTTDYWPSSASPQRGAVLHELSRVPSVQGQPAEFQISPRELPTGLPSTFYVRVIIESGRMRYASFWLPIALGPAARRP